MKIFIGCSVFNSRALLRYFYTFCVIARVCRLIQNMKMDFLVNLLDQNRKVAFCVSGAAVALLGLALGYKYTRRQKKLTDVGVVSQLLLHPMKSGKAVCVPAAECLRMGLKSGDLRDR